MASHDPATRSLIGRLGAHVLHANLADPVAFTAAARRAFMDRFYDQVDPDRVLPQAEREQRAEHARRAYFLRLALKSAESRRARKEPAAAGGATE